VPDKKSKSPRATYLLAGILLGYDPVNMIATGTGGRYPVPAPAYRPLWTSRGMT